MDTSVNRQHYFDKPVHHPNIKAAITGKSEHYFVEILESVGFKKDKDFYHQYPVIDRYVLDIAFDEELVNFELDGDSHKVRDKRKSDRERDEYLKSAGWDVYRINEDQFLSQTRFYKYLIYEIIKDYREKLGLEMPKEW